MSNKARNRPATTNLAVRVAKQEAKELRKQLSDVQIDRHRIRKALDAVMENHQQLRQDLETARAQEISLQAALVQARVALASVMLELGADEVYLPDETVSAVSGGTLISGLEIDPDKEGETLDMTVRLVYLASPVAVAVEEVPDEDSVGE